MNLSFQPPEEDDPRDDDQRMQDAEKRQCQRCGGHGWVMVGHGEAAGADECPVCVGGAPKQRGYLGSTPDGGIDDHDEEADQ